MDNLTLDSICNIRLYQRKKGYRFSLDAVLLARFVKVQKRTKLIADLGAGSGVIGLIIAKTFPWTTVHLYELQDSLYELCKANITLNGLDERAEAFRKDIRDIDSEQQKERYDMVVTNPPFRAPGTGAVSPYDERALARHELALTLEELLRVSSSVLKNRGYFYIIYHTQRMGELISLMRDHRLEPKRIRPVYPMSNREATMILVEAVKNGGIELRMEPPLIVYKDRDEYTDEVKQWLY
jgi:tRNA1Val (adenine37-N6)-methyltransferase